jgi:hypothetical protein
MTSSRALPFDSAIAALYKHSLNVFSVNANVSVLSVIVICDCRLLNKAGNIFSVDKRIA